MPEEDADALVHAIARDWRNAPLSDLDRALCAFAAKLTHHQHEVGPADLDALRALGLNDRAIHDAVQVIAYFNYITRIADGLGVEPETFIQPWGRADNSGGSREDRPGADGQNAQGEPTE